MKKTIIIIFALIVAAALLSENVNPSKTSLTCKDGAEITGKKYNVVGSRINVRKGPGTNYERVVNQRTTDAVKSTQYISIDDSLAVFEECKKDGWSWIRVLQPDSLKNSHRGWVLSKFLDKDRDIDKDTDNDPYARKIGIYALVPYDVENYPKTFEKYGTRMKEIEKLRRKAAEMAADSEKCDRVEMAELSSLKSSLNHLHFWVDCKNKERIRLDEFEIKKKIVARTQKEKAWDADSAKKVCRGAIISRASIPSELDIHDFVGTSVYEAPITHNVVVTIDFDAKNAFGVESSYTARCYFPPNEPMADIEFLTRP